MKIRAFQRIGDFALVSNLAINICFSVRYHHRLVPTSVMTHIFIVMTKIENAMIAYIFSLSVVFQNFGSCPICRFSWMY